MQSPGPTEHMPWAPTERAKTNGTSIFALLASLSGFVCFVGIGGALGIVLGLIARNEISRSEGREAGRGLATGAVVIGVANLVLSVVGLAVGITYLARPSATKALATAPAMTSPPAWVAPVPPAHPSKSAAHPKADVRTSRDVGTEVTVVGAITLADIGGDFETELGKQHQAAEAAGEALVLWVVVRDCKPCDGVAAALATPLAQKALGKVRFVRVDRDEFQIELDRLSIPTEKIPGFALLDARDHVRDFIHGGEWDADVAANIAPVLGKFVHGAYRQRRHPWQGSVREDETPI